MRSNRYRAQKIKEELNILDDQQEILKQNLSAITSRKEYLKEELEWLGHSGSLKDSRNALSKRDQQSLIAGLTK